jgi:hypothetical protein
MSENDAHSGMNVVEVNLSNQQDKNASKSNSDINYHEINTFNSNKHDNSGEGFNNLQEENEEEQEQEELSMAEIEHLKKIHEQTLLRSEKYANLYSPQNSDKKPSQNNDSNEKKDINKEDINNVTNNILEILNENDNEVFNEYKINPNEDRIFKNIHCYFFFNGEPLIIIGPDLEYFILVFTLVSFFSILVYSLKTSSSFTTMLFVLGYISFSVCYILLMVLNPGIPIEKKHYDINDLNNNYKQCKICNCIYYKEDFKNVNHCEICGICVEECENHCNFATKCIGKNNKKIYKAWIISSISFAFIMFLYLIF